MSQRARPIRTQKREVTVSFQKRNGEVVRFAATKTTKRSSSSRNSSRKK